MDIGASTELELVDKFCYLGDMLSVDGPWTLNFILHAFLHPIIIIFSQHMPIPTQPVLQQYQCYVIYT